MSIGPLRNTDKELWRETPGDYYSPTVHVTEGGGIGISVDGLVIVLPIRKWHRLAEDHVIGADRYVRCGAFVSGTGETCTLDADHVGPHHFPSDDKKGA